MVLNWTDLVTFFLFFSQLWYITVGTTLPSQIIYVNFIVAGKSLYIQRLYEKLEATVEPRTVFKKCIRLTDHEVDEHKVLKSLYETPRQSDINVFHIDVTSTVSNV